MIELTVSLADGSEVVLEGFIAGDCWNVRAGPTAIEAQSLPRSLSSGAAAQERNPRALSKIMRRVSGYNLDEFVKRSHSIYRA